MTTTVAVPAAPSAPLPYGPWLTRLLRPLQRGFLLLNRGLMAPLLGHRLGWLVGNPATGYIMLLRTRGRRSGLVREAPLGYVLRNGCAYCVAGYGAPTPWYQNLLADPRVEVVLPTSRFHGLAEPVTDPAEWLAAYRDLIGSFGLIGRSVVGDIHRLDDAELLAHHRTLPVIRITPVDDARPLVAGAFDPGGRGWLVPYFAALAACVLAWSRASRLRHRG